jgi:hypothetical protein
MDGKKLIYADDFISSLRDDPLINGANFKRVVQHINDAPAVDTVVHAKWINIKQLSESRFVGFCSACCAEQMAQSPTALIAFHRHCRWCGAKMDGGNEDV